MSGKLAAELRAIRARSGKSAEELSRALGINRHAVGRVERGARDIKVTEFVQWCLVCGVRPGDILDELYREYTCERHID